jgi:hypothetical protein
MIEANISQGKLFTIVRGEIKEVAVGEAERHHMRKPTEREMVHFLDCLDTGKKPTTDAPSSVQGLRVIWRLYEAEDRHGVADLRGLGLDQVDEQGRLV